MKPKSTLISFLALAGSSLLAISSASAQTNLFWDADGDSTTATGGLGTWNTASTWRSGSSTGTLGDWADGDVAVFGGTAGTVTLTSGVTVSGLTFNTTGYTITGSTLTLAGATAPVISASVTTTTISSDIAGTNGLEKTGAGTLILSGTGNEYSGTTTITAGTLQGNKSTLSGPSPFGTSTIQLNAGTQLSSHTLSANDSAETYTFGNDIIVGGNATIDFRRTGGTGSAKTHAYGNLSIGSNTLSLTAAAINHTLSFTGATLTGNAIINNGSNATLNLGAITETGGARNFTKQGVGTLRLTGVNTYTGDTTVNGGTLQIGNNNGGKLGGSGGNYAGNISITSGTLSIASNVDQTLSGIISGAGNLTKENSGTLFLGNSNTYTGKTTITPTTSTDATISIASFNSVNGGTPLLTSSSLGAPTTVANGTIDLGSVAAGRRAAIIYTGAGETTDRVINFRFNNAGSQHSINNTGAGLLKFTSAAIESGSTDNGGIILGGDGNGEFSQGLNFGFGNLVKNGNGTWTLGGPVNSGNGTNVLTVNAGTLALQKKTSLHNGDTTRWTAAKINVKSGATLALNVDSGDVDGLSGSSLDTLLTAIYGGTSTSQGLQAGAILGLDTSTATGGTFTQGNAITNSSGTGGGSLGLTKLGTGTLILDKDNTFTGATKVTAGTLLINGSTSSTSLVTVNNGGTLGGTGTVGGAITVNGALKPGNSTGLLTVGSLDLTASATTTFEINGTNRGAASNGYDALGLNTGGSLDLAGALIFEFGNLAAFANNTEFDLFSFDTTATGDFASVVSTGFYAGTWGKTGDVWSLTSGSQTLNFSEVTGNLVVVPEPRAALLGGLGLLVLLRRRRA